MNNCNYYYYVIAYLRDNGVSVNIGDNVGLYEENGITYIKECEWNYNVPIPQQSDLEKYTTTQIGDMIINSTLARVEIVTVDDVDGKIYVEGSLLYIMSKGLCIYLNGEWRNV